MSDYNTKKPALVPYPKDCNILPGYMKFGEEVTIGLDDSSLLPQARVFADELSNITGSNCLVNNRGLSDSQITLKLDSAMEDEQYRVQIDSSSALVVGGSPRAVAWGCVTISQLAEKQGDGAAIPCATIEDKPDCSHRGMMVDLARHWHPIEVVQQCVVLCRWYKVKYLHLHFVDDPLWTLPSDAFPSLPTPDMYYTKQQLADLEGFACACGVTIIPEIDVPGHSKSLVKGIPELVATSNNAEGVICPGRESTYEALDTLIGETLGIFKSTPYFHIGADEVDMSPWETCDFCRSYMKEHNIPTTMELYRHFIVRMREIVAKYDKQTVVWEGFAVDGDIQIPKDIIVMEFESHYEHPAKLLSSGYKVVNTSWQPLYVVNDTNWSPEKIFSWNIYRWEHFWEKSMAYQVGIDVPRDSDVIGGQLCAWEQPAEREISSLRLRLAALSEKVWNVNSISKDFMERSQSTDTKLSGLL